MSATLQQHGRSITGSLSAVTHRQGSECGELVSTSDGEVPGDGEDKERLSTAQQIGIALAVLVLIIGGGAAAVGGV